MDIEQRCFLTDSVSPPTRVVFDADAECYDVVSPVCGHYRVQSDLCGPEPNSPQMISLLKARYGDRRHLLAAIALASSRVGAPITLARDKLDALLADWHARAPSDPMEQIGEILRFVYTEEAERPGRYVTLYEDLRRRDLPYPIAWAHDAQEFTWLVQRAFEMGLMEARETALAAEGPLPREVRLTADGYKRVEELRTEQNRFKAFVAMWFDDSLDPVWRDGIRPALAETGWSWTYLKDQQHNEKIDDLIISELRQSGLLVADFTGHRQNVYFEAGFAMGLGIPVIWTCRSEEWSEEEAHFDTRQYNYIVWDDPADLKNKLKLRIQATLPYREVQDESTSAG